MSYTVSLSIAIRALGSLCYLSVVSLALSRSRLFTSRTHVLTLGDIVYSSQFHSQASGVHIWFRVITPDPRTQWPYHCALAVPRRTHPPGAPQDTRANAVRQYGGTPARYKPTRVSATATRGQPAAHRWYSGSGTASSKRSATHGTTAACYRARCPAPQR